MNGGRLGCAVESQPSMRRMATAAPMTAARITPVCASMAPAKPPCQAGLQLGEPGLELVGRHVVSVVGCLSHGGRDGVGELRVGAGGDQGAGDSVGVESGHASFPSLALPVGSIGDAFPAAHPCGDASASAGFGLFAGGGEILR